jgi:formate--tetrahydrofolate ligase
MPVTDIEIARRATLLPIWELACRAGIEEDYLEVRGRYKAKLLPSLLRSRANRPDGRLILVTAVTPTPAGEGKTTVTIGLADALSRLGESAVADLREPSLGPVFGLKGGATGGGLAQVAPMEDINLHFTGDFHAIGAANNLLCALLDNHIYQGNRLDIDPRRVTVHRCVDMNDRQLRGAIDGLGRRQGGVPRADAWDITVATEVMAVLCLAGSLGDLKARLGRMLVGYTRAGAPVTAHDLHAEGAMTALLRDAIMPNLAQTLERTPALIHGGPFANIAHGCSSVLGTRTALKLADWCVTEAGFGADLGAEKFLDIKCPAAGLTPDAVVLVATVRALKMHGGAAKGELGNENLPALRTGFANLRRHYENLTGVFGLPCVVAVNRFPTDTDAELTLLGELCGALGAKCALCDVWGQGGAGGETLARLVMAAAKEKSRFTPAYDPNLPLQRKIDTVARRIYGADGADFTPQAAEQLAALTELGFGALPVCIAKTQYSFSDDPKKLGAPEQFRITVREIRLCAGAGFVVALTGDVLTMPGLPPVPAAESIDVDDDGNITGIF